jgi:hypothetical protein
MKHNATGLPDDHDVGCGSHGSGQVSSVKMAGDGCEQRK